MSDPIHSCGTLVVDADGLRHEPDHDPTADWYCPACRAYFGDQELDVFDGTWSVETCDACPFLLRSPSPNLFGCRHPCSPSVTFDSATEVPQWCPLREGPITIRLTRPRS